MCKSRWLNFNAPFKWDTNGLNLYRHLTLNTYGQGTQTAAVDLHTLHGHRAGNEPSWSLKLYNYGVGPYPYSGLFPVESTWWLVYKMGKHKYLGTFYQEPKLGASPWLRYFKLREVSFPALLSRDSKGGRGGTGICDKSLLHFRI